DLAGHDLLALLAVVRVHLEDAADALGATRDRVEDAVARLERAGVDPEVRQLADVRIRHDLEGERRERRLRVGRPLLVAAVLRIRSEEHTSELQSQSNLVCRLLLEKKKKSTLLI